MGRFRLEADFRINRDSPDDSQTGVSIRVLRPCRKTDARCRRLPAPRLARTVVEGPPRTTAMFGRSHTIDPIPLRVGPSNVCFSNRPFEVNHFQTIHHCSVDVAQGLALLFGIGTKALVWGFLCQGVRQGGEAFLRRFLGSISKPVSSSRPAHR